MSKRSIKHWQALLRKHAKAADTILDLFTELKIDSDEGEQILLLLAGMSAGLRLHPVTGNFSEPIAVGWQLGVRDGGFR